MTTHTIETPRTVDEVPVDRAAPRVEERPAHDLPGLPMLGLSLLALLAGVRLLAGASMLAGHAGHGTAGSPARLIGGLLIVLGGVALRGLTTVTPGQGRVVQLFGSYSGTIRAPGLRWVNPFALRRPLSTRLRNHETAVAKVNDADGNPIEIAAVVVWQVADTARALYAVDDFVAFVALQAETAVRHIATNYPYDAHGDRQLSLRDNAEIITAQLCAEIAARVEAAGVRVIEARLSRLAYAPEIAHAMLQRQQADAIVAARQRIVAGAVGMVELALARLAEHNIVELDEERKAAMVSNLLVVLCADRPTQPVVNTGSLYH
ncbi:MAG: SPFH domain-containing protein [Chloroflexota bacterium]|nr:SPFH domain-containing protein [Chloroflexota bacterium]